MRPARPVLRVRALVYRSRIAPWWCVRLIGPVKGATFDIAWSWEQAMRKATRGVAIERSKGHGNA